MEISTAAPPSLSLHTNTPKSPDADQAADTPAAGIHPTKSLPFSNGVLKRHAPPHLYHHHQQPPATTPPPVTYKECMKNHAAAMGGHALDGCGEFMPSPAAVATDPTSLKCAACGCHRNFHRRETPGAAADHQPQPLAATPSPTTRVIEYHHHHRHHPPPPPHHSGLSPNSQSPPPISSSFYPASAPHMLLALSGGGGTNPMEALNSPHTTTTPFTQSRKRFRTKFTQFQKEKMHEFAEKLGWKMQKTSEDMVAEFCNEVGVERGVFKVWMHNNKNTFGKNRDLNGTVHSSTAIAELNTPATAATATNDDNGSSGNSGNIETGNGSNGYSKNGDGAYGSSTSS